MGNMAGSSSPGTPIGQQGNQGQRGPMGQGGQQGGGNGLGMQGGGANSQSTDMNLRPGRK
jgi:hypothetical protein